MSEIGQFLHDFAFVTGAVFWTLGLLFGALLGGLWLWDQFLAACGEAYFRKRRRDAEKAEAHHG